jgi:hypothetical protein
MAPKLKFQGFAFLCWAEILRCAQQKKCAMGGVARKLHPTVSAGGTTAEPSAALVHTTRKRQGILSPPRMPFRHPGLRCESVRILSHSCNRTGSAWKVWVSADASDCFQIGVRTHRNQKKRRKCIRPRTQAGVRRRISCQKRIDLFLDRPATGPGSNSF